MASENSTVQDMDDRSEGQAMLTKGLEETLADLLDNKKTEEALAELRKEVNKQYIQAQGWDLIPIVCRRLSDESLEEDNVEYNVDFYQCCGSILNDIATIGNPKEVLLGLLEQAECLTGDNCVLYLTLLKPIQVVLLRLPEKRGQPFEWVLETLHAFVTRLHKPKNYILEGEEKKLADLDPAVRKIEDIVSSLVRFYEPFVKEVVENHNIDNKKLEAQKRIILYFLLKLFDFPLSYVDLSFDGKAKSSLRVASEIITRYVIDIECDLYKFVECYPNVDNPNDCKSTNQLSLGTLYYMLLSEHIGIVKTPFVYNPVYVLQSVLPLVVALLSEVEIFVILKGLNLARALFVRVSVGSLGSDVLDNPVHGIFSTRLTKVVVYCESRECREQGVKLLDQYLCIFNRKGKYQLLKNLFWSVDHSGIKGYLTLRLKDVLLEELASEDSPVVFRGEALKMLIEKVCSLEHGVETDLLETSDQIISSLNLLRYLFIRDARNVTGVWDLRDDLRETFLDPLRKAVDMSRAHYKLKLNDLQHEKKKKMKTEVSLTVAGQKLQQLPSEKKKYVVNLALNTFDIIDSLLARVNECVQGQK